MTENVKFIERPYKVYSGCRAYPDCYDKGMDPPYVEWSYEKSFRLESDAEAFAERLSEDYEFVKIEKKENN